MDPFCNVLNKRLIRLSYSMNIYVWNVVYLWTLILIQSSFFISLSTPGSVVALSFGSMATTIHLNFSFWHFLDSKQET